MSPEVALSTVDSGQTVRFVIIYDNLKIIQKSITPAKTEGVCVPLCSGVETGQWKVEEQKTQVPAAL